MTAIQKAALSLLISVFLFAGFTVLAFSGLFDLIETRFYNPSIVRSLTNEVEKDAKTADSFFGSLTERFAATLSEPAVQRSFLPNQSGQDILERSRVYGVLMEELGGLQSVRFVDSGGIRIHFSTSPRDIFDQNGLSIAYSNYDDDPDSLPYTTVAVPALGEDRIILDEGGDRIIFAHPFYDSLDVYRGTAVFTLSVRAVAEWLINESRINVGEDVTIISNPPGMVSRIPGSAKSALLPMISGIWAEGYLSLSPLDSAASGVSMALISARTSQGIFVGRLVNESSFEFPDAMKVILLVSTFITLYLVIFLIFNLRQDTMTVIQNRLKSLQISLIEQYYDRKGDVDWNNWSRELEQRRDDVRAEVKRGIRISRGSKRSEENIDTLIDKSWDELLSVIGGRRRETAVLDEEKLQGILNRILQSVPPTLPAPAVQAQAPVQAAEEEVEELGDAEELEDLEEVEPAEEVEDVEEVEDAETVEELEEVEDAEVVEDAEEVKDVEEVEAAEVVEDVEEVEPAEEVEEPEDVAEAVEAVPESAGPPNVDEVPIIDVDSIAAEGAFIPGESPAPPLPADVAGPGAVDGDDVEELEELEEIEGAEPLEELAEEVPGSVPLSPSHDNLADLTSKIEFTPLPESNETEEALDIEMEIVSPFVTMLSDFSGEEDEEMLLPVEVPDESEAAIEISGEEEEVAASEDAYSPPADTKDEESPRSENEKKKSED
ncbi:MAG: hypothetical protein LBK83_10995 [Treponema sp.]|nr:hypothetical protein [Treponema sp.]